MIHDIWETLFRLKALFGVVATTLLGVGNPAIGEFSIPISFTPLRTLKKPACAHNIYIFTTSLR